MNKNINVKVPPPLYQELLKSIPWGERTKIVTFFLKKVLSILREESKNERRRKLAILIRGKYDVVPHSQNAEVEVKGKTNSNGIGEIN